jgi:hypothetical protein
LDTIDVSPAGVASTPGAPENVTPGAAADAVQPPGLPHDGGAKLMFEPLMSSINAPEAGPVQKLAAWFASTGTPPSVVPSKLVSATVRLYVTS